MAIVALLWNSAGARTIMMAQAGRLPDLEPGMAVYYTAQSKTRPVAAGRCA